MICWTVSRGKSPYLISRQRCSRIKTYIVRSICGVFIKLYPIGMNSSTRVLRHIYICNTIVSNNGSIINASGSIISNDNSIYSINRSCVGICPNNDIFLSNCISISSIWSNKNITFSSRIIITSPIPNWCIITSCCC